MRSTLLFAVATFFAVTVYSQTTVTLTASRDLSLGYHDNYNTANNNYYYAHQTAGFVIPGASGGVNSNRGLIDFDLSGIPAGAEIQSASLDLYALVGTLNAPVNQGHFGDNSCYLRRVTGSWEETITTWNTAPMYTTMHQVILAQSTSPSQDYLNVDVTAIVQDMIDNPSTSHGFWLGLVNEALPSKALLFCSLDHNVASKFPQLHITYGMLGVKEQGVSAAIINVFPNPSEGLFEIAAAGNEEKTFEVTDINGKVLEVKSEEMTGNHYRFDLTAYPAGTYFLAVSSVDGNQVVKLLRK